MRNVLRPVVNLVSDGVVTISAAKEEVIARHEKRPDNVVLEDLLKSTAIAATYLLTAATGKNVSSIGLQDRTIKPWARKLAVALAARQVLGAGVSGMVLWHRHREAVELLEAYECERAMYA